ncbi:MAG: hypothetical protein M1510_01015, partial [Nitrospirae bacterium]|nr:hypothetical protein [Nitrospirota bacterium]
SQKTWGKRFITIILAVVFCLAMLVNAIAAEKIRGVIKSIDSSTGAIVVTDKNSGKDTTIIVENKEKLKKYKVGDETKIKYEVKGNRNVATDVRTIEGC